MHLCVGILSENIIAKPREIMWRKWSTRLNPIELKRNERIHVAGLICMHNCQHWRENSHPLQSKIALEIISNSDNGNKMNKICIPEIQKCRQFQQNRAKQFRNGNTFWFPKSNTKYRPELTANVRFWLFFKHICNYHPESPLHRVKINTFSKKYFLACKAKSL